MGGLSPLALIRIVRGYNASQALVTKASRASMLGASHGAARHSLVARRDFRQEQLVSGARFFFLFFFNPMSVVHQHGGYEGLEQAGPDLPVARPGSGARGPTGA